MNFPDSQEFKNSNSFKQSHYSFSDKFGKVVSQGSFAYPAWKRYGSNPNINVVCDNCDKQHLKACVGLDRMDLCLDCVKNIVENSYGQQCFCDYNKPFPCFTMN
jgi:hypothetical protein